MGGAGCSMKKFESRRTFPDKFKKPASPAVHRCARFSCCRSRSFYLWPVVFFFFFKTPNFFDSVEPVRKCTYLALACGPPIKFHLAITKTLKIKMYAKAISR